MSRRVDGGPGGPREGGPTHRDLVRDQIEILPAPAPLVTVDLTPCALSTEYE